MQPFENVIFAQHRVVELDLRVIFLKFLPNFGVGDYRAACDQAAQFINQDPFLHAALELSYREVVLLQQLFIRGLPDEVASREKCLAIAAMLQLVAHCLVRRTQAEVLSLRNQSLPLDQLLGSLRREEWQQHRGLRPTARKLLADHFPGLTLNFQACNIGSSHLGDHAAGWSAAAKKVGAAKARD